jgi:Plasmid stabilisation system protein.
VEPEQYRIIIAPAANDKMYEHFEFLAQVNEGAAKRLLSALTKGIRSLETMPHRNPPYDRPYLKTGKYRYLLAASRYRVVYQIEGDTVFVDDIQDCRQDDTNA